MRYWRQVTWIRKALKRSEAGIATAEMAVVMPLLMLMFLATADFGRVLYTSITLAHAARAGAQYGTQDNGKSGDFAGMTEAAKGEAQDLGPVSITSQRFCKCPGGTTVNCITGTCGTYGPPQIFVQVTASQTFNTIIPYPGISNMVSLSRAAILRVQ